MKLIFEDDGVSATDVLVGVELTRRNLTILLAKLDENRDGGHSACTLVFNGFHVRAVEDEEHYADREPGLAYVRGRLV